MEFLWNREKYHVNEIESDFKITDQPAGLSRSVDRGHEGRVLQGGQECLYAFVIFVSRKGRIEERIIG